ncbi:MAG: helix-turn-helix domain-containing protein [Fusicatenibacter sp.]|nr:AraC family transcriptional regulator [Fusicatenibacter sp.]
MTQVTQIALEYGFSSPSYFSTLFKRLIGSTPLEYRNAVQKSSV